MERKITITQSHLISGGLCHLLLFILTFSPPPTSSLAATDFQGALKSVTITDTTGANAAPTAIFTYATSGSTTIFDAAGSTDSDGTITLYKWDFGDGTTVEGIEVSHDLPAAPTPVTLIVTDNLGGVAIYQQTIDITAVQYGPELVINGTFDGSCNGWKLSSSGATCAVSSGIATITNTTSAYQWFAQDLPTVKQGSMYTYTLDIVNTNGNICYINILSQVKAVSSSTAGTFTGIITTPLKGFSKNIYLVVSGGIMDYCSIDNISIREILP